MRPQLSAIVLAAVLVTACSGGAKPAAYLPPADLAGITLPEVTDPNFCVTLQQFLSVTTMVSENTVFDTVQGYIESKTSIKPLRSYQYVTAMDGMPVIGSCKIKGAAYIRNVYGEAAAGEQRFCPAATAVVIQQVANELTSRGDLAAAQRATAFVIDNNEPFFAGPNYLASYELSYADTSGAVHIQSQGLFHDYDHWSTAILPDSFVGPVYCNVPSHDYIRALATGAVKPGLTIALRE